MHYTMGHSTSVILLHNNCHMYAFKYILCMAQDKFTCTFFKIYIGPCTAHNACPWLCNSLCVAMGDVGGHCMNYVISACMIVYYCGISSLRARTGSLAQVQHNNRSNRILQLLSILKHKQFLIPSCNVLQ